VSAQFANDFVKVLVIVCVSEFGWSDSRSGIAGQSTDVMVVRIAMGSADGAGIRTNGGVAAAGL
jgi:hypothetical protein